MIFATLHSFSAYERAKRKMLKFLKDLESGENPEYHQDKKKWMQSASFKAWMWGRILLAAQSMHDTTLINQACDEIEILSQVNLNTEDKDELARITWAVAHYAAYSQVHYQLYKDLIMSCAERLDQLDSSETRTDAVWGWVMFLQAAACAGDRETYDKITAKIARDETIVVALNRLSHTNESNDYPAWAMAKVRWAAAVIGDNALVLALQEPTKKSIIDAEKIKTTAAKVEYSLGILDNNLAILAKKNQQKKFEQAIVDGHFILIDHPLDHPLENKEDNTYELSICSSDLEIVFEGEKQGIRLDQFLLKNDWDKTLVAVRGERDDDNSHTKISYVEQQAVNIYVEKYNEHHVQLKKYFDPKEALVFYDGEYPDLVREKYKKEIKQKLESIRKDLKTLICLQSAFNKARIQHPHASEEVYRDIQAVRLAHEMTNHEVLADGRGVVQAISGVSTARRDTRRPDEPPAAYFSRNTRFVISKGSDAIPLSLLLNKEKYPELYTGVVDSENESSLGLRPTFFVRNKPTDKQDKKKDSATKFQYTLEHITLTDINKIEKVQKLWRWRLMERNKLLQTKAPAGAPSASDAMRKRCQV